MNVHRKNYYGKTFYYNIVYDTTDNMAPPFSGVGDIVFGHL